MGTVDPDQAEEFLLYPNPVKDVLNIKTAKPADRIEIYDMTGRLVNAQVLSSQSISVAKLQSGVYVVKILYKNETVNAQKIIKE